jgi:hypothetical protein
MVAAGPRILARRRSMLNNRVSEAADAPVKGSASSLDAGQPAWPEDPVAGRSA